MRTLFAVGMVVVALGLSGCGNQKGGEEVAQQMINEMNSMSDALEKGDMAAAQASLAKLNELGKKAKEIKVTKSQDKAIEDKFKPQLEAAQGRMMKAMMGAMTNKNIKPEDLKAFTEAAAKLEK